MNHPELTPEQQAMVEIWDRHTAAEFEAKDIDSTMATMTDAPFVNHVPVMTGDVGFSRVRDFYLNHFIPGHPPDTEVVRVARTVGRQRIVDELIHKFTHTIEMPWILPGVPPTGRLAQDGLLDAERLPATGREAARKVLDPGSEASNLLIDRVRGSGIRNTRAGACQGEGAP